MGLKGRMSVLGEILQERQNQIESGYTENHDDAHPTSHLAWLLARRANDLMAPFPEMMPDDEPRRLLLEIATISVAAIEAIDRKEIRDDLATSSPMSDIEAPTTDE